MLTQLSQPEAKIQETVARKSARAADYAIHLHGNLLSRIAWHFSGRLELDIRE